MPSFIRRKSNIQSRKKSLGASMLEFALVLFLALPIGLGFIFLMGSQVYQSYAQYATYMAARTYLAADENIGSQEDRAREVFEAYMQSLPEGIRKFGIPNEDGNAQGGLLFFDPPNRHFTKKVGVRYQFRTRILPKILGPFGELFEIEAESFLGREVSHVECSTDMAQQNGEWDNGC
jgi:hypothetical protein